MAYRKPLSKILGGVTRFGRLTFVADSKDHITPSGQKIRMALFRCDCGSERAIRITDVRNGLTISCGCFHHDQTKRHGQASDANTTPEYRAWTSMKYRCSNPRATSFSDYGGRGITVCERWRESFEAFYADMGPRPSAKHSIDRIDNDGNYEPANCRWQDKSGQAKNRRSARIVNYAGRDMTLKEAAQIAGLDYRMVHKRLRMGWPIDSALGAS